MTKEQAEQYLKGIEVRNRMKDVWNKIYDKGTKPGVTKTVIDNTELWYFREAVRRDDFDFFLSAMDNPPYTVDVETFKRYLELSSELWEIDPDDYEVTFDPSV